MDFENMDTQAQVTAPQDAAATAESAPTEEVAQTPATETNEQAQRLSKVKALLAKITDLPVIGTIIEKAKALSKKIWISIAAAVVAILVLIAGISIVSNTYRTPLNISVRYVNQKEHRNIVNDTLKLTNGFCEDELKAIFKLMKESDNYEDLIDEMESSIESMIEYYQEQYGDNYKCSYRIEEKEKLDKSELREMRNSIKEVAKELREGLAEAEEYDSYDWDEMADDLGVSRSTAKKFVKAAEDLYEELRDVKVTAGYRLTGTSIIKGSELDEPEEEEFEIYVYKINGRWVGDMSLTAFSSLMDSWY